MSPVIGMAMRGRTAALSESEKCLARLGTNAPVVDSMCAIAWFCRGPTLAWFPSSGKAPPLDPFTSFSVRRAGHMGNETARWLMGCHPDPVAADQSMGGHDVTASRRRREQATAVGCPSWNLASAFGVRLDGNYNTM
jgi:hypothetical protein